jgi:hypothetical protein
VQKLTDPVQIKLYDLRKTFYSCSVGRFEELSKVIQPTSTRFGLLLAADFRQSSTEMIADLASDLLKRGLVYLCAWGPDCERAHDIFDEVQVGHGDVEIEDRNFLMTTWHDKDSLGDATFFFVHSAAPAEPSGGDCSDWIVASVGNADWDRTIKESIRSVLV